MDTTALVGFEVENGAKILRILNEAGLQIKVALWGSWGNMKSGVFFCLLASSTMGACRMLMACFTRLWMPPASLWGLRRP